MGNASALLACSFVLASSPYQDIHLLMHKRTFHSFINRCSTMPNFSCHSGSACWSLVLIFRYWRHLHCLKSQTCVQMKRLCHATYQALTFLKGPVEPDSAKFFFTFSWSQGRLFLLNHVTSIPPLCGPIYKRTTLSL